ncbi:hypothetical protein [Sorangium sp. So ce1078]|uniref:hypothetical protein n=1 Tax=Sorangium sp. So ce1078 TaxID=3133329 RepID=UPI003F5F370B
MAQTGGDGLAVMPDRNDELGPGTEALEQALQKREPGPPGVLGAHDEDGTEPKEFGKQYQGENIVRLQVREDVDLRLVGLLERHSITSSCTSLQFTERLADKLGAPNALASFSRGLGRHRDVQNPGHP